MKRMQLTYGYDDVTLVPAYSDLNSRSMANPKMHSYKLPIIVSCMDTLGRKMMNKATMSNIPFIAHRAFKSAEEQFLNFFPDFKMDYSICNPSKVWFAVGSSKKYKEWIDYLLEKGVRKFCVDMAHGDSLPCIETVKYIREKLYKYENEPSPFNIDGDEYKCHIIAGNVATSEGFRRLQNAGANGIRIGVASGQICSTAINTGFGVPILTNIIECNKVRKKGVWIIADGGVKAAGDIAKAVYFGADFCMIGKLFASTDLADGRCYNKNKEEIINAFNNKDEGDETFFNRPIYPEEFSEMIKMAIKIDKEKNDRKHSKENLCIKNLVAYKEYHGMASRDARRGVLSYASVEGVAGLVKYKCLTEQFIRDMYLNLEASLSYAGARNWKEFRKNTYPVMRSNAGIIAADTHLDITIDK